MEDEAAIRVTLVIDRVADPISGWLECPPAMQQPFVGLLDLIGLLERARAGPAGGGSGR